LMPIGFDNEEAGLSNSSYASPTHNNKLRRAFEIFDGNSSLKFQIKDGIVRICNLLNSTSAYHTMLCIHLSELSIRRAPPNVNIVTRCSSILKVLHCPEPDEWDISIEEDAIIGNNNLIFYSIDNRVSYKIPFKSLGDDLGPDLEVGIPLRTVNISLESAIKLLKFLLVLKKNVDFIKVSLTPDNFVLKSERELLHISLKLPIESSSNSFEVSWVEIDVKHFARSLFATKLECISVNNMEISIGISKEAMLVKINQPKKWTCVSILALRQRPDE
jgi:hypothetical protein